MLNPLIYLAHFPQITYNRYTKLKKKLPDLTEIYTCSAQNLVKQHIWDTAIAESFVTWRRTNSEKKILENLHTHNIRAIALDDAQYPKKLQQLPQPPLCLFVRGSITLQTPTLAIVGTRKATSYAMNTCTDLIKSLAHESITIVSGLAYGIDTIAHRASLDASIQTLAVLAGGIDTAHIHPKHNTKLAEEIIALGGGIISEYPPETPPTKYTFPLRNRIIAAVSDIILVIEAPKKSGALITAEVGLELGKDIAALPHPITSITGFGTNMLIQNGAFCIAQINDVRQLLALTPLTKTKKTETLSDIERNILQLLDEPQTLDSLVQQLRIDMSVLLDALFSLEQKAYIHVNGLYYSKKLV